jgi:hypothetical protein
VRCKADQPPPVGSAITGSLVKARQAWLRRSLEEASCIVALLKIVPLLGRWLSFVGKTPNITMRFPGISPTKFWPKWCKAKVGHCRCHLYSLCTIFIVFGAHISFQSTRTAMARSCNIMQCLSECGHVWVISDQSTEHNGRAEALAPGKAIYQ